MTYKNKTRDQAVEGMASEGARMDRADTDPGPLSPDALLSDGRTSERPDELSNTVTDEDIAAVASFWIDEENSEEWMNNWSGRVKTHSMLRSSYE